MVHDLQSLNQRVQIIAILGFERQGADLCLHVFLQCWKDRRFHGVSLIHCSRFYDFCIRPPDFNIIEGGPDIAITTHHPLLWINQPHCALIITVTEDISKWQGPTAERALAALFAWHRNAVGEFIPFDAASGFQSGPKGLTLYGPKHLMDSYATVLTNLGFHPKVEQIDPHGQAIPGGDGAIYDPPLDLHLLLLDRSWVIAERFYVQEVISDHQRRFNADRN